jgi:hypothetical protein
MRRFRFHLGSLVILVVLLGVGFASLRESNEIWDRSMFNITLSVLLVSILLAIHRTERSRAFWLGFALFGSAYLGLALVPSIESRPITTKGLAFRASKSPMPNPGGPAIAYSGFDHGADWNSLAGTSLKGSSGTTENFVRIGHSLIAIVAALLGGQLSRYLHTKNKLEASGPVPGPVSISNDSGV